MALPIHIAMSNQASLALMKFLSDLAKRLGVGKHIYVVGGAPRNFVIRRTIQDIDVVIDSVALGGKDSNWFSKEVAKAIPAMTRIQTNDYGVALLHIVGDWMLGETNLKGEDIEIANARTESYTDGGYKPDVVERATIEDDVRRREFTFNCMAGDTLIPTEKGILRIDQIVSREGGGQQDISLKVAGQNGPATAVGWQYSGFAPTLRVATAWGHSFACTHHHPVLVLRGHDHEWVQADQLGEGDMLCVPVRQVTRQQPLSLDLPDPVQPRRGKLKEVRKPDVMTPELAFVIGGVVAEGSNTHKRVSFSNSDQAFISRYIECFQTTFGFQPSRNKVVEKGSVRILRGVAFVASKDGYDIYADSKAVVGWLADLGLYCGGSKNGKSASHHKVVPWAILQADERSQWAFLAAYLEGGGSIRPDTGRITFCSASPHIRRQLQVLLGAHGILSKVKDRFVYINAVDSALLWEMIQPWMVTKGFDYTQRDNKARNRYGIPADYIRGFLAGRKQDKGRAMYATDGDGFRTLPDAHEPVRKVQRLLHDAYARGDFDGFMASLKVISPDEHTKLQGLFDLGYQYVEVTSVEDAGEQDVFDISMDEGVEPAFVANGLVVHNTLLWRLQDLASGPDKAEIIDLSGCGLRDLQEGVIKCPSSPDKTFKDDATRMIRAIKFITKYGFKLSPDTEAAIRRNKERIRNIKPGHLITMLLGLLQDSTGKKALDEMQRLGLLDIIKDIAQKHEPMRSALGKLADNARADVLFAMMDMGMPSGRRLGFLDRHQIDRLREITVTLSFDATDMLINVLKQPGKAMDMRSLMAEFQLKGKAIAQVTELARRHLLDDPALSSDKRRLTQRVRLDLKGGRAASGDMNEELRLKSRAKKTEKQGAVKGDSSSGVGLFFRLPEHLASQFPSLGEQDDSPVHSTFLYVGDVKGREDQFLQAVGFEVAANTRGPVRATLQPLDYFTNPDKGRRVALNRVRFSHDMAQLRDRIRVRLLGLGFEVEDGFPLVYQPHVTLQYMDDLDAKFEGAVPTGSWMVDHIEVWGMPQVHTIPLSRSAKTAAVPRQLDHIALFRHVIRVLSKRRVIRWESITFDGLALEILNPDLDRPDDFTIRFPGSSDQYRFSGATKKWRKRRKPVQEIAKKKPQPLTPEEREFYNKSPQEIVRVLQGVPKSMLSVLALRQELLPAEVLRYLTSQRYTFVKKAKMFELNIGDPLLMGKYLNSPGRIEKFKDGPKGDPMVVVRKRPKKDEGKGSKKEVKLFKVRYDKDQAKADKAEKKAVKFGPNAPLMEHDGTKVKYRVRSDNNGALVMLYYGRTRIGGMNAFISRYPERLERCSKDVWKLLEKYPQVEDTSRARWVGNDGEERTNTRALQVFKSEITDKTKHGLGIGKAMYLAMMAEWFQKQGPFLFMPYFCSGSGTSKMALRVWKSLARTFPSSGYVIAVLKKPAVPAKTASERLADRCIQAQVHKVILDTGHIDIAKNVPVDSLPLLFNQSFADAVSVSGETETIVPTSLLAKVAGKRLHLFMPRGGSLDVGRLPLGRHLTVQNSGYKPMGAFWTSPLMGNASSWMNWIQSEIPEWRGDEAALFTQKPGARVLLVSKSNYPKLLAKYPHEPLPGLRLLDWEKIAKEYDGVHGTNRALPGWDSLSSAWWNMDALKYVGTVPIRNGQIVMANRLAAKFQNKKQVKTQGGDDQIIYEYSDRQIADRNRDKAKKIEKLRGNLHKLQSAVTVDLKSKDDKTKLCALAVGLMNDTYERVGNEGSAKDGHFGVTGWQAQHVSFSGSKAIITYVGKSGVSQKKTTTDSGLVAGLKAALKGKSGTDPVFEGVGAGDVNAYLKPHGITAKDIRGLHANREVQTRLKAIRGKGGKLPTDKKDRQKKLKKEFDQALEEAAEQVGHEPATLKSQYLVPGMEDTFMRDGTVKEKLDKQGGLNERILDWMAGFGDPLTLYREIYVNDPKRIRFKELGRFWTPEKDKAHSPFGKMDGKFNLKLILQIKAPRSAVNELETLATFKRYPGEREIRLKPGTSVRVEGYWQDGSFNRLGQSAKVGGVPKQAKLTRTLKRFLRKADQALAVFNWGESDMEGSLDDPGDLYGGGVIGYIWRQGRQWFSMTLDDRTPVVRKSHGDAVFGLRLMSRIATKSQAEKEDDEVDRLTTRKPKKKPPRYDLRRNRFKQDDPDLPGFGADGDRDLSNNYKKRAAVGRVAERWIRHLMGAEDGTHKPGTTWQTEDGPTKGSWVGMNQKGNTHTFGKDDDAKAQSEAFAKGESNDADDVADAAEDEAKAEKAKKREEEKQQQKDFSSEMGDMLELAESSGSMSKDQVLALMELAGDSEVYKQYKAEMTHLRQIVESDGISSSMMKDMANDPFKGLDLNDKDAVASALAEYKAQETLLLNPSNIGGKPLSSSTMKPSDLVGRAEAAMKQFRHVSSDQRRVVAKKAVKQLASFDPESPEARELNSIIDGLHAAAVLNDEPFNAKNTDGSLLREPLSKKLKLLVKQTVKNGDVKILFMEDPSHVYQAEGREKIRDVLGKLDDEQLIEMSQETAWQPLADALAKADDTTPKMDPEVREYLRSMMRDMGVNQMTTVQGIAASIVRQKSDPVNESEAYDRVAEELSAAGSEDVGAAVEDFLQKCLASGESAAACMVDGSETVQRVQLGAVADAADKMDDQPNPQDVPVAIARNIRDGADLALADDMTVRPEKTIAEKKREYLRNVSYPSERKRIEKMTDDEFSAMLDSVFGEGY